MSTACWNSISDRFCDSEIGSFQSKNRIFFSFFSRAFSSPDFWVFENSFILMKFSVQLPFVNTTRWFCVLLDYYDCDFWYKFCLNVLKNLANLLAYNQKRNGNVVGSSCPLIKGYPPPLPPLEGLKFSIMIRFKLKLPRTSNMKDFIW